MANIRLIVEVDYYQIEFLKKNGYRLCIAKAVARDAGSQLTVIWDVDDFLYKNKFEWSDNYKVFGALNYRVDAIVESQTEFQRIESGQTCVIDDAGNLNPATGSPDQSGTFAIINHWKDPMNIGIACTLVNNEKLLVDLPFYVTPDQVMSDGTINLTPIDKISVWFQEFKKTGMMIDEITGPSLTVDFTGQNPKDVTISFRQDGTWQNGPLHQV